MLNYNYIWICIAILILGIIDTLIKVHQTMKEDSDIRLFWSKVCDLYDKIGTNSNIENEIQYIISESKYIDKLLTGNSMYSPVFYFVDDISHRKFNDQDRYLDAIYKLIIQHEKENKTRRIELCKALLNPIELFCRGIEFILRFCFAYFLSMIKSDFDYNGKTWRFVVGVISFISAVLTILGFFGVTFSSISSYCNL
jgi:hypothetical protein